ncbi:streptophobe family protein [Streptomyces sp. ZAF1911]|uniref:streptophobe family protein n=1 Tax=Streptomyces sp. ZAF1911 TaxID=2944129 RepID=UPI00237B60A2|nr:streptophobe family protein [Streptomyces sp. ZAF1911]MDD9376893.1 streptophobe family protein [Streptomyces sp. ZAF1911]
MQLISPGRNALEGAAAALCAVAAMAVVSALALALLGAGSVGSAWSLTMAVTAMAVGGSVSAGSEASAGSGAGGLASLFGGGSGMGPSISGAADVAPLSVTLIGAVVLWVAFSWRLRQENKRRFTAGELVVRAAGAGTAAWIALMVVGALGQGSAALPEGAMGAMGGPGGGLDAGGPFGGQDAGGPFGDLAGGGGLGDLVGGMMAPSAVTYQVNAVSAGLGAVVWAAVVLGIGCLISRRVRLPLGGALDRLRATWAPSLSAVVRTMLVLAAVVLVPLVLVGAAVGDRAGTLAGGALLLAPNALAVFLSLGAGSSWTLGMHPVQSSGSNPLAGLMGQMGGSGGMPGLGGGQQTDRTEHLRSLAAGGWPLWLVALAVTGAILLGCAYRASRTTHPAYMRPLHPYSGPLARHLGMAERFSVVTAVVLGGVAWLAGASGNFGISMFGSQMGGMQAELAGSVLQTAAFGLLVGGLAGFAGSLLHTARGARASR